MSEEFLALADLPDSPTSPWQLIVTSTNPFIQVYRYIDTDFCFRVVAHLNATPEAAFDLLADITRRMEWDSLCEDSGIVEEIDKTTKVMFMKTKGIWPTAPRDVCVLGYVATLSDGRYLNVTRSIVHDGFPPRDKEGVVRMDAKIAGQVVGPHPDGIEGMCRVVQVADGDLKGWIPQSVIGWVSTKAVPYSFKTLNKVLSKEEKKTDSIIAKEARDFLNAELNPSNITTNINNIPAKQVNGGVPGHEIPPSSNVDTVSKLEKRIAFLEAALKDKNIIVNSNGGDRNMIKKKSILGHLIHIIQSIRNVLNWCSPWLVAIIVYLLLIKHKRT